MKVKLGAGCAVQFIETRDVRAVEEFIPKTVPAFEAAWEQLVQYRIWMTGMGQPLVLNHAAYEPLRAAMEFEDTQRLKQMATVQQTEQPCEEARI